MRKYVYNITNLTSMTVDTMSTSRPPTTQQTTMMITLRLSLEPCSDLPTGIVATSVSGVILTSSPSVASPPPPPAALIEFFGKLTVVTLTECGSSLTGKWEMLEEALNLPGDVATWEVDRLLLAVTPGGTAVDQSAEQSLVGREVMPGEENEEGLVSVEIGPSKAGSTRQLSGCVYSLSSAPSKASSSMKSFRSGKAGGWISSALTLCQCQY